MAGRARKNTAKKPPKPRRPTPAKGPNTASLLNLYGLRLITTYVERFQVTAPTCQDSTALKAHFDRYLKSILLVIPLRSSARALDATERCDADFLELRPNGELRLVQATNIGNEDWLPEMAVMSDAAGKFLKPQADAGVAAYCVWSNLTGTLGVAVAPDVPKRDVVFYERRDQVERGLGWYDPSPVGPMYKEAPRRGVAPPPYKSILSAAVFVCAKVETWYKSSDECVGVLNITSDRANTFTAEDFAWAEHCASLIGSLYRSYRFWTDRLNGNRRPDEAPGAAREAPITTPAGTSATFTTDTVVEWLSSTSTLDLDEYRVVGGFMCAATGTKRKLLDFLDNLKKRLATARAPIPVLLCAPPGSGKTFFVREVAAALGHPNLVEENLSDKADVKASIDQHLQKILTSGAQVAFLDEADTRVKGEYAYRFLMKAINGDPCVVPPGESEEVPLPGVVWFFAASIAPDLETFRKHAHDQADQKGPDFLRRFDQNGYVVELPGLGSPQERALRLASLLRTPITQIDARALYFVAKRDWRDAGELSARVKAAIRKCAGGSILKLEDVAEFTEIEGLVRSEDTGLARLKDHLLKIRSS